MEKLRNADIFYYLENEANKLAISKNDKFILFRSTIDVFKEITKIDKVFAEENDIGDGMYRVAIVLDDHQVIGTFDYQVGQ